MLFIIISFHLPTFIYSHHYCHRHQTTPGDNGGLKTRRTRLEPQVCFFSYFISVTNISLQL